MDKRLDTWRQETGRETAEGVYIHLSQNFRIKDAPEHVNSAFRRLRLPLKREWQGGKTLDQGEVAKDSEYTYVVTSENILRALKATDQSAADWFEEWLTANHNAEQIVFLNSQVEGVVD